MSSLEFIDEEEYATDDDYGIHVEDDDISSVDYSADVQTSIDSSEPISLDGYLYVRKGRATGHGTYLSRKRFVSLSFEQGGVLKVFKEFPSPEHIVLESHPNARSSMLQTVYSRLHRSLAHSVAMRRMEGVAMYIPANIPWMAKDMENDSSNFVIEIPSSPSTLTRLESLKEITATVAGLENISHNSGRERDPMDVEELEDDDGDDDDDCLPKNSLEDDSRQNRASSVNSNLTDEKSIILDELRAELCNAQRLGKPVRIHFRCSKGSHEKALWLKAFSKLGRLSSDNVKRKKLFGSLSIQSSKAKSRGRTRRESQMMLANDTRDLDLSDSHDASSVDGGLTLTNDVERLIRGHNSRFLQEREYRVLPSHAYPHRWMTRSEMQEEMVLPSDDFHNPRVPECKDKEIGSLKVEVLQCLGLPKLDRTSDTDAVVYMVLGSYAFATDIIPNRTNPIWLRKTRRAVDFPVFHGYARLFVGVFDDDGKRDKDDFAGRVVIDLARLRPHSTYDVTLPLRLSTHVYSRRKRGAIRLRFTLNWYSEREALLSYIPKSFKIPLPQNTKPNFNTTVNCSDKKAFRNIAITVHGAHLPGRFTFHQMRAGIREMNFTRKYIFTAIRQGFRDTRQWKYPAISAFIFLAWMHSIYMNAFSLVPAYFILCCLLYLIRNYVKYGIEAPSKTGFIPPSWEELFFALLRGGETDYQAIETLELGCRPEAHSRRSDVLFAGSDCYAQRGFRAFTHKPQGLPIFRALGFLGDPLREGEDATTDLLEFPFADAADYPKFTVKESLIERKGEADKRLKEKNHSDESSHHARFPLPRDMPQFPIDMHLIEDYMRKDDSGLKEYDEEEINFTTKRAVFSTGRKAAKTVTKKGMKAATTLTSAATKTGIKAASTLTNAANELTEMTGLNHVVSPISKGISSSSAQVRKGISHSSAHVSRQVNQFMAHAHYTRPDMVRRGHSADEVGTGIPKPRLRQRSYSADEMDLSFAHTFPSNGSTTAISFDPVDSQSIPSSGRVTPREDGEVDPALVWPEQNIDIEGPSTGKKLTDDLVDIKDKIHELTWHKFDDYVYVLKNPDAAYFGYAGRPERRRKDTKKQLNKLLQVGQYSHSNPFVARVGLYVEPIIGSVYSFLCLFRAGFNVFTWQDPMLTFWLSVALGLLAIILFVFPWRLFFFVLGFTMVGPQNWIIRILRERGHLPPLKQRDPQKPQEETYSEESLACQPVFKSYNPGENGAKVDPREIHSVVVPYSPLMYQRFYDWPPEPVYAQVKPDTLDEARRRRALTSLQRVAKRPGRRRNPSSSANQSSTDSTRNRTPIPRVRPQRRTMSFSGRNGQNLPPRRRAATADWPVRHVKMQ